MPQIVSLLLVACHRLIRQFRARPGSLSACPNDDVVWWALVYRCRAYGKCKLDVSEAKADRAIRECTEGEHFDGNLYFEMSFDYLGCLLVRIETIVFMCVRKCRFKWNCPFGGTLHKLYYNQMTPNTLNASWTVATFAEQVNFNCADKSIKRKFNSAVVVYCLLVRIGGAYPSRLCIHLPMASSTSNSLSWWQFICLLVPFQKRAHSRGI